MFLDAGFYCTLKERFTFLFNLIDGPKTGLKVLNGQA